MRQENVGIIKNDVCLSRTYSKTLLIRNKIFHICILAVRNGNLFRYLDFVVRCLTPFKLNKPVQNLQRQPPLRQQLQNVTTQRGCHESIAEPRTRDPGYCMLTTDSPCILVQFLTRSLLKLNCKALETNAMMDRHETLTGITVLIKSDNSFVLETRSRRVDGADKSCALLTSKKETGFLKSIYIIFII